MRRASSLSWLALGIALAGCPKNDAALPDLGEPAQGDLRDGEDLAARDLAARDLAAQDLAAQDLAAQDLAAQDLAAPGEPDLSAPADLLVEDPDLLPVCVDSDSDGHFTTALCGPLDACDGDPNAWEASACASTGCRDDDEDGYFTGCDRYATVRADCDDSSALVTHAVETIGNGVDEDCDGADLLVEDAQGVFVASSGDDDNPGTKAAPVATLAKALALAIGPRRAIFLAGGTYAFPTGNYDLARSFALYGGFESTNWTRDLEEPTSQVNVTDLRFSGQAVNPATRGYTVVAGIDGVSATASTFRNGLYFEEAMVVAKDSQFRGASTPASGATFLGELRALRCEFIGGGTGATWGIEVLGADSRLSVTNSQVAGSDSTAPSQSVGIGGVGTWTISDNTFVSAGMFTGNGVGLGANNSGAGAAVTIIDSTITAGTGSGGASSFCYGISLARGTLSLHRTVVTACSATATTTGLTLGGAAPGTAVVVNSLIDGSTGATNYGVFSSTGASLTVVNSYVKAETNGLYGSNGANIAFINSIVKANGAAGVALHLGAATQPVLTLTNSALAGTCRIKLNSGACIDPDACNTSNVCAEQSSNLLTDCGIDSENHIPSVSACKSAGIDAASHYVGTPLDLDEETRPQGGWDIGPDEIPN